LYEKSLPNAAPIEHCFPFFFDKNGVIVKDAVVLFGIFLKEVRALSLLLLENRSGSRDGGQFQWW
jgi:hypothetical protein